MGSEGFVFEYLYILLDAVSIAKLLRIADKPLEPYLVMMSVGLFLCIKTIGANSFG